jgi:DNA-binding CsgD family transcriptional regulator/PAS domain-containing protein
MDESGHLLDLVYETVLEPGLWVTVMERIADSVGGNNAWLSRISLENGVGTGLLARIEPETPSRYIAHYGALNPIAVKSNPREYMRGWRPWISTENDYMPRDALTKTEFYNDFLLPLDVGSVMMIDLAAEGLDVFTVNIHRSAKRDPFGPTEIAFAEELHSHLIRALKLGGIFSEARDLSDGKAAALDRMAQGIVILDAQSRIRHANRAAERMLGAGSGLSVMSGRLIATRANAAGRLAAMIGAAASPDPGARRGGSMTVASAAHGSLSVTVAPLYAQGLPVVTTGPAVLVTLSGTQPDNTRVGAALAGSFALTPAEVRVSLALLNGASPKRAAAEFGVSVNTIRTQMASIFGKTGTAGQAELSRLLQRLADNNLQ